MKKFFSLFTQETVWGRSLVAILVGTVLVLGVLGHFDTLIAILSSDRFSLHILDASISLYEIIRAIFAVFVLFWGAGIIATIVENQIKKLRSFRSSNRILLIKAFHFTIYFLAIFLLLDFIGIDLTALAVLGGAVGIGIGVGLQKISSNFISGLILLFEKSVEVDDLIELDDGIFGLVRNLGGRYTLIETFEGREIMVPNEDFITSRVTNWTFSDERGRIMIPIGVSYDSDLEKVQKLIVEAAEECQYCSSFKKPECYLREYGDSSVNFILSFWVDDIIGGRYLPQSDVMMHIWKKFKKNHIEIPFPQRDIHIKTGK